MIARSMLSKVLFCFLVWTWGRKRGREKEREKLKGARAREKENEFSVTEMRFQRSRISRSLNHKAFSRTFKRSSRASTPWERHGSYPQCGHAHAIPSSGAYAWVSSSQAPHHSHCGWWHRVQRFQLHQRNKPVSRFYKFILICLVNFFVESEYDDLFRECSNDEAMKVMSSLCWSHAYPRRSTFTLC